MKAAVLLALVAVAAARPQFTYPIATPTVTVDNAGAKLTPTVYTSPIPTYGGLTYNPYSPYPTYPFYSNIPAYNPFVTPVVVKKEEDDSKRHKRSADAEPQPDAEADPLLLYTAGGVPYPYTYPVAGTTYPLAGTTTYPLAGTTAYRYPTFYQPTIYNPYNPLQAKIVTQA